MVSKLQLNKRDIYRIITQGGGGVLKFNFTGYVPLASQSPYPIIVYSVANYLVTFGQIFNFRDPSLVAFYFYELTIF